MSGPLQKQSENCSAQLDEYLSVSCVGSILCSAYASTMGWMQVEPQQRNGTMNLLTSVVGVSNVNP